MVENTHLVRRIEHIIYASDNENMNTYPPPPDTLGLYLETQGITQARAAVLLHVDVRTIRRWVADKPVIPFAAWYTLRCLVEGNRPY